MRLYYTRILRNPMQAITSILLISFIFLTSVCDSSLAKAETASLEARQICSNIANALLGHTTASGSFDQSASTWSYDLGGNFAMIKGGSKTEADRLTFGNFDDCAQKVENLLSNFEGSTPISPPGAESPGPCIVATEARDYDVTESSPEMGGGHTQPEWCSELTQSLRGREPQGIFTIITSSESSHSTCSPFNCPAYTYHCTVHVHVAASSRPGSKQECQGQRGK